MILTLQKLKPFPDANFVWVANKRLEKDILSLRSQSELAFNAIHCLGIYQCFMILKKKNIHFVINFRIYFMATTGISFSQSLKPWNIKIYESQTQSCDSLNF